MRLLAAIMVALLATPPIAAEKPVVIPEGQTVTARCIGVRDGDSTMLLVDTPQEKRQSKIRMDAIDAPELGQPTSNQSKQTLSGMMSEKKCHVESLGPDKHGRSIGRVTIDGKDGNAAALEVGIARHGTSRNMTTGRVWPTGTTRGCKARVGLWGDDEQIPPWEKRKMSKEESARDREKAGARYVAAKSTDGSMPAEARPS